LLYWFLKAVLTPIVALVFRVRVRGARNIPRRGAAIVAANHQAFLDSFFIPFSVRFRRVTYVAKAEYFDSWKTRWFFRGAGQIPITRDGGDRSQAALETAGGVLARGKVLGIYPEGTRSPDGRLHKGKTGAARLAIETGAPLVPCAVVGSGDVQRPGSNKIHPAKVTVRFGEPLDVERYRRWADRSAALRALTDELMAEIQRLSGQEFVNRYATDVKGNVASRPAVTVDQAA